MAQINNDNSVTILQPWTTDPNAVSCGYPSFDSNPDKSEIIVKCTLGAGPEFVIWAVNNNQLSVKQVITYTEIDAVEPGYGAAYDSPGVSYRKR